MSRFTTFLALVVGGMEVTQPAAAVVLAGLSARIDLRLVSVDPFQRRQTTGGILLASACDSVCTQVINIIATNSCPPSDCCSASFETAYFNCLVCIAAVVDLTDYTQPQSTIDQFYDECASSGLQLPVLTFPGKSPNRPLSSVAPPSSQTTASTITFAPLPVIIATTASTITSAPSTSPTTASTQAPNPTSSLSSGVRSVETSCFNLIASAMMLGLWSYFAVQ